MQFSGLVYETQTVPLAHDIGRVLLRSMGQCFPSNKSGRDLINLGYSK